MSDQSFESPSMLPDKLIYQDFYESFRFSQGMQSAQLFLFQSLAGIYDQAGYTKPDLEQPKYLERILALRTPGNHGNLSTAAQKREFLYQWSTFNTFLTGQQAITEYPDVDPYDKLAHDLMGNDLSFVYEPKRKRYGQSEQVLKSYYREYVMLKTPVASPSFNTIIGRMHTSAEKRADDSRPTKYDGRLGKLAIAWNEQGQGDFTEGTCQSVRLLCQRAVELVRS